MQRRVLVIDDDPDLGEALADLLASFGHAVLVATTGVEACALAEGFSPDVVFCDLGLPEMDGYAIASALRANPACARATIVALTGDVHAVERSSTGSDAFDHRLLKPVDGPELERILQAEA